MKRLAHLDMSHLAFVFAGGPGSRMEDKCGLSKHLQPITIASQQRPIIAYIFNCLQMYVDQIVVGVAYRARKTERYLRRVNPSIQALRLPEVSDLGSNLVYATHHLRAQVITFFYGDVLLSNHSYELFFRTLVEFPLDASCPVMFLLEVQMPESSRSTFEIDTAGFVTNIRPSSSEDVHRYSTLAVAVDRVFLADWSRRYGMPRPYVDKRIAYTVWPAFTAQLLQTEQRARAVLAPRQAININTRADLKQAELFLQDQITQIGYLR